MHDEPEEQQPLDPDLVGGLEHVDLDPQVVPEEVRRPGRVRQDAADPGGGQHDHVGTVRVEEGPDVVLAAQVELAGRRPDQVGEPLLLQVPPHGRPHQAAVPGHITLVAFGLSSRPVTAGYPSLALGPSSPFRGPRGAAEMCRTPRSAARAEARVRVDAVRQQHLDVGGRRQGRQPPEHLSASDGRRHRARGCRRGVSPRPWPFG